MSIDINKLASLMRLNVTPEKTALYGTIGGYNTYLMYFKGDMSFAVRIYANHNDKSLREALYEFSRSREQYSFVRMWEGRVTAIFTLYDTDTEETAQQKLTELYSFVASLGFAPCCSTCGGNRPARLYGFTNDGLNLCEDCEKIVAADVTNANAVRDLQKPKIKKALPGMLIGAASTFLFARYTGGKSPYLVSGGIDAVTGIMIAVIIIKALAVKTSIKTAAVSAALCLIAYVAGNVMWHADYFAKFNKDHAAEQQYIIDYCDAEKAGENPYQDAIVKGDNDLISKYKGMHHLTPEEREDYYKAAVRIVEHQTTKSCVKDFYKLMYSDYGDKMRKGFMMLNLGGILGVVIGLAIFWRLALKVDSAKYKLVALPTVTLNPYDIIMSNGGDIPPTVNESDKQQ